MSGGRALAFDLGGTRLKAGVVEVGSGEVIHEADPVDAPPEWVNAQQLVEAVATELRRVHPDAAAVGLALPGVIDAGRVASLPGKLAGAEGADVAGWLASRVAGPGGEVVVVNDAIAAGVGEATAGAGSGARRTVVVTLGTGVGVCVVEDGRPLGGGPFGGGILGGQVPIGPTDPGLLDAGDWLDTAGRTGTIEARCRAQALVAQAGLRGGAWPDARAVVDAARAGDVRALDAVAGYRADVARALASLAHAHAPDRLVVGGGLAASDSLVLRGLEPAVNAQLSFGLRVGVFGAVLGSGAALAGLGVLLGAG